MSDAPAITLVCCGLIGAAVADEGMVERAFAEAIATQGVVTGTADYARCMAQVHRARGQSTIDILLSLFPDNQPRAQAAQLAFDRSYAAAVGRTGLSPLPGAEQAIDTLTDAGIRVCLITGFSRRVLGLVLDTLGWWDRVQAALCPEDVPRGCPAPDLVLCAMLRLGVGDVRETAVADGTENGVLCGLRAGAGTVAAVLTGTHTAERLRGAGAHHLLASIADLPDLLAGPARLTKQNAATADRRQ